MRGPGRLLGILLVTLLIAAMAVGLNRYADEQAEEIVASAPDEDTEGELDEEQSRECAAAQAAYDEVWDASVENPQDQKAEEALEEELTKLIAACES